MRRIRLYHQNNLSTGLTVMLDVNASHHLLQVLRKKVGERFVVFNGQGGEFDAVLVSANKKTACVEIGAFYETKTESALKIHLGQAMSRSERMDYAIQKSVEYPKNVLKNALHIGKLLPFLLLNNQGDVLFPLLTHRLLLKNGFKKTVT